MAIEKRVLEKLDFDKMTQRLAGYCLLRRGQEIALALLPYTEMIQVERALDETGEAKALLRQNPLFSVRGAKDIQALLARVTVGGVLTPEELLLVKDTLKAGRAVRQGILESDLELPWLREKVVEIEPQRSLEEQIGRCITEECTVADQASRELGDLRRSIGRLQQRIRESLESVLRNTANQKLLQELLITQRSERYVVPVKQEYRGSFPGIVHDQSASGATLFIEPMAVVQLGNELREVSLREQREVQRILQELSFAVSAKSENIDRLHEALSQVDFILAKAQLSLELNAGKPILLGQPQMKLVQARHPLLSGKVVPLSVELGMDFDTLVITGPNTGGKTVALKTMGLLVSMAQAGLHISAEEGSKLGIFSRIFIDVGDEQSVEQSLSTFSGHMKNIVKVVEEADARSLILLDEIGAGTDPTEGAALAMAVLEDLHRRGARIVATTHYGALKTFAYKTARVENGSVDFDVVSLRPTYRLLIGIPGKSNAFNIAAKLGLKESVLTSAKAFLNEREIQVADLIENLEDTQREIEKKRRQVQEELALVKAKNASLAQEQNRLALAYEESMAKARDEAAELLRQAKREAEELIRQLKEAVKQEHKDVQAIQQARTGINTLSAKLDQLGQGKAEISGLKPSELKLGQTVYMTELRQKGQVLALPNESGEVLVQAGIMKVMLPLKDLRFVPEEKPQKARISGEGRLGISKVESVRNEIDLRGMLVEEATQLLDKYLDDAVLSGVSLIYVIHGKGTGALRAGVQDFLRRHPHVKGFRIGQHGEGDFGVTVVELK